MSWLAVGLGAACGAWLRWGLGMLLNAVHGQVPLGTLCANLLGGYLIGLAAAFFGNMPSLSPEWRLFVMTGFLGGLTTFSTFSLESLTLLQRGLYLWAAGHALLHLAGAVLFCFAGFASYRLLALS